MSSSAPESYSEPDPSEYDCCCGGGFLPAAAEVAFMGTRATPAEAIVAGRARVVTGCATTCGGGIGRLGGEGKLANSCVAGCRGGVGMRETGVLGGSSLSPAWAPDAAAESAESVTPVSSFTGICGCFGSLAADGMTGLARVGMTGRTACSASRGTCSCLGGHAADSVGVVRVGMTGLAGSWAPQDSREAGGSSGRLADGTEVGNVLVFVI
jgi:hypothetical protein